MLNFINYNLKKKCPGDIKKIYISEHAGVFRLYSFLGWLLGPSALWF
jgi:hypothetical protein